MPPPSSKKGSAGPKPSARDRRSASRHSTPVSALTDTTAPPTPLQSTPSTVQAPVSGSAVPKETPYTHTPTATLLSTSSSDQITLESLIDRCNANGKNELPSARALHELESNIRESLVRTFVKRGETANASMRQLVQRRKERERAEREVEAARAEEAEAGRVKREKEERKKAASGTSKKRAHEEMEGGDREGSVEEGEEERKKRDAPSVGAHGLARQDGVGVHQGEFCSPCLCWSGLLLAPWRLRQWVRTIFPRSRECYLPLQCFPTYFASLLHSGTTSVGQEGVTPPAALASVLCQNLESPILPLPLSFASPNIRTIHVEIATPLYRYGGPTPIAIRE